MSRSRIATLGCRYGRVRTRRRFVPRSQSPERQTLIGEFEALAQPRVARNHAERHGCGFAMPVPGGSGPVPMAMSRPAVSRPTTLACMAAAMVASPIPRRGHPGICISGCCVGPLVIRAHAISGGAAGEGTEQGQALIVGVRRLNFFAVVDAARSGVRLSGDRDQRGNENGGQNGSQGFILFDSRRFSSRPRRRSCRPRRRSRPRSGFFRAVAR
jgi:hypothetical protein